MLNPIGLQWQPQHRFLELGRNHSFRYHELAVWRCFSKLTGRTVPINGPLAQILEKYPFVFRLQLIAAPIFKREG